MAVNQSERAGYIDYLVNWKATGAMLSNSVRTYDHAMRRATAVYRDDHKNRPAWVSYFYAWFSLVCPLSISLPRKCMGNRSTTKRVLA